MQKNPQTRKDIFWIFTDFHGVIRVQSPACTPARKFLMNGIANPKIVYSQLNGIKNPLHRYVLGYFVTPSHNSAAESRLYQMSKATDKWSIKQVHCLEKHTQTHTYIYCMTYLFECEKCQFKFPCVGSTVTKFRFRFNNYKSTK